MSSHVIVRTLKFCTTNIENLLYCLRLLDKKYENKDNLILIDKYQIETTNNAYYMRVVNNDRIAVNLFNEINGKLAEIEEQIKFQEIEKCKILQEEAEKNAEMYRARKVKQEIEAMTRRNNLLELERKNYVEAKKQAIIEKAKAKGYSVQEHVENGVVKLKLIKRIY